MDNQLWATIMEIQQHTTKMNQELGMAQVDIAWLKYSWNELLNWIRIIGTGVSVGLLLSVWNLIVLKKNGKTPK